MMDEEFSWVKARHACSVFSVYARLQLECERDVEERNALRAPLDQFVFKISVHGDAFLVLREGYQPASVAVRLTEAGISANRDAQAFLKATLTLNDEGECRLKVGEDELTLWQFRRRALEDLFFGF